MPYESEKEARLMRAVAHGWKKPGGGGPSETVAKKFVAEDKQHPSGYAEGGPVNKGYVGSVQSFAQGGPVLGRTRDFIKTEDRFRGKAPPPVVKTDEDWSGGKPKGRDKSLTPVKPHK